MRSDVIKRGAERAPHRSLLRATGSIESEADFDKPFIAICNSYTDCIPGHAHLNEVGMLVKRLVREAGGVPFIFNTIGVDDGIAMGHSGMKYSLPSRELIADCVESMVRAHCFDGMICIPNCDKIVPGMLMAAMRVNLPTLFVSGGPMAAGVAEQSSANEELPAHLQPTTKASDLISVFQGVGELQSGKITEADLRKLEQSACPTCGSCSGMFTANSMNCLCEALGLALPGNGSILAVSKERENLYRWAARQIIQLVEKDIKPRDIATLEAFDNALMLDVAMGGSTNTVLHTLAIAREAGIEYDIARIDGISRRVPCLCKVSPSSAYHMQDIHRAGGIHTILGELKRMGVLNASCKTVTGKTLAENIDEWDARSDKFTAEAAAIRISGASALVLDPDDKLGPAARMPNGNLVPKPMMFLPADERAIALWREAAAWQCRRRSTRFWPLLPPTRNFRSRPKTLKGHAELRPWIEEQFKLEARFGSLRTGLDQRHARLPALAIRQGRGARPPRPAARLALSRRLIAKAYHRQAPVNLTKPIPAGLTPYDPAFLFDAKDCIRSQATAYSPDGGLAILYGQLAPEGSVVKTAGISAAFKQNCGPQFVFEGPCVVFESQEDACEGILGGKVKAGDVVDHSQRGPARRSRDAGNALPHQLHRGHGPGRQDSAHHRRPF